MKLKILLTLASCLLALTLAACAQHRDPQYVEGETDSAAATDPVTDPGEPSETEDATEAPTDPDTTPAETMPDGVVLKDVYPTPMEITHKNSYVDISTLRLESTPDYVEEALAAKGATFTDDRNAVYIAVILQDLTKDFEYGADEAYILTVTEAEILIRAQTERGAYYGFMTLLQLMEGTHCPLVTVKDAPRNSLRGVIEGFYGTAWTHEYRKDLFAFMGQQKMNAYIYAPKDDAKHRAQWRVLYSGEELDTMRDLINTANDNYVKFIYAISPGGDIDLGDGYEDDLQKLIVKCEQIYSLGCRDFAILLDDIPTLDAEGHAKLLNDFQTKFVEMLGDVNPLIAITTEYGDPFLTDYTDRIAPLIHEDIVLMWTGPGVIPESITNASLQHIIKIYGRKVLIWWNYPVNDTLANHLFMDACQGLEKTLYQSITGLTANPMNQGYASLVPLFTTGDYLWNPEAYDKDASLEAACKALMPDAHEALLGLVSMTGASSINQNVDSVEMNRLLTDFKKENTPETRAALKTYFESMVQNADAIVASENQKMVAEIREWLTKYRAYGEMGIAYIEMEEAFAAGKEQKDILPLLGLYKSVEASIANNPRLVSASVLTNFLNDRSSRFGVLLGLVDSITCAPATPYTNCNKYQDFVADFMTDGDNATYFWTHGNLPTAAGGKEGYFGVDLGSVIEVKNVYVATGVGGSDVLRKGILEYSSDGKTWTVLFQGDCKEETYLRNLSVKARYVRMRSGDNSDTSWVKVRSFEVNTTRVIGDEPAFKSSISTTLPTYQSYVPDFMADGNENTYFWSGREGRVGDYFQIDLGDVTSVSRITFKSGVPAHPADYVNNGELSYSTDGVNWTVICPINSRDTVKDVDIRARYIRVSVKATQTSWITVSEFSAVSEDSVSPLLDLDEYFIPRTNLLALTDGHLASYLAVDGQEALGHTLRVTVGESGKVTLTALGLPPDGLTLTVKDGGGQVLKELTADYITTVEAPAGSIIEIPLGKGFMPAEIAWS